MNFSDLQFNPTSRPSGIQARILFPNGYGASVVKSDFSYGGKEGLYELAVLKDGKLCYDTAVTSDVRGRLNEQDVESYLNQIKSL
jgi:hypothetical protein